MTVKARNVPMLVAAIIMMALFAVSALRYEHFGTFANVTNLVADYAYVIIAAVGATLVILMGGIDLSVGSVAAFTGVLMAWLIGNGWHPMCAAAVGIAIGASSGGVMGLVIQVFELPAFMVTLVGMFAIRAASYVVLAQSTSINHPFLRWAEQHLHLNIAGVEVVWPVMVVVAVGGAAATLARLTPFGRCVYAIGGSEKSARMMGVPIARTRVVTYALAGMCSALAGCVLTAARAVGDPSSHVGLELTVIAAAVIGGTQLSGGVGSIIGTVVGVFIIGLIRMIIDFEGSLNAAWTSVATGALLLAFVVLQRVIATLSLRVRWRHPVKVRSA